jgi:radical SAM protein with 4Fe4S-binding SPASM domain
MLFRQKLDTFIRHYGDIGYVINKGNVTDMVVNASGSVFLSALSRTAQSLDDLIAAIVPHFAGAEPLSIKDDVLAFYKMLEDDGFIISGETNDELNRKDPGFSYKNMKSNAKGHEKKVPVILRAEESSQNFLQKHFGKNPQLISLHVELTSRCNERCVHCYIPHKNKKYIMEDSLFDSILEQCHAMGTLELTLSGGEPLSHPHFCSLLHKAKKYDFSINLLSNLTLLNDEILSELKKNCFVSIQTSLYSMNPEHHDAITQLPGSFEKTKKAILRLIDNNIPVQISCPVMKQNKDDYGEVLQWAHKHNMRAISDYIMMARYDHSTDNLDNRLSLDDVEKVIKDIMKYDWQYDEEILNTDFSETDKRDISDDPVCGVGISSAAVLTNGKIYPCSGWQDYICGDLSTQALRDIWQNSPRLNYLRALRKRDFPKCIKCPDKTFCAICMVRNANENNEIVEIPCGGSVVGNPLKINEHFCKVAALNRKIVLDWKNKTQTAGNSVMQ